MEIWILIAVITVGMFLIIHALKHVSQQLANLQAQIIQFQNQINNIVNEKRDSNKDTYNKDSQIKSIEEAVSEIRDHLVPPRPGTLRAEMEEIKNEAAKWGVDV